MLNIIYTTINNLDTAEKLAAQAVKKKLAACVNIIPKITSIYMWENKIEKSEEYILFFKTTLHNKSNLIEWIEKNHPYQIPAIISFNADTVENFYKFIEENTQ